ncbi:hypothetical protein BJ322DRAFT_831089 [Thelephora terrestris]|uniref:RRM domain-containing protein n=1 Tax=Thelephora terrestris TaxID=56493 RepID=A0A9P6L6I1_9AGAM|nr:hypothetical protein BJ322DRAFT_831089 [Thelephora terrestris]
MLIHPAAIVALLFYLIIGQPTFSERFQTRRKLLGQRVRRRLSVFRSRHLARFQLPSRAHPITSGATTTEALPIALIETIAILPAEVTSSFPVPPKDYIEVVIPEAPSARQYGQLPAAPPPPQEFVITSRYRGPFHWHDLLNLRVLETLTLISVSISLPLVAIPFAARLFSRSESPDEVESPLDELPERLPPKFLSPPKAIHIQISTSDPHAPPEPVFLPAPPKISSFWLAAEEQQQGQPSSPSPLLLRLLDLPSIESEYQKKISPLPSPADSGYGTVLPDTASEVSSLTPEKSVTTTPESPAVPLPTTCAESNSVQFSNNATAVFDNPAEENVAAELDPELEDEDDGSTTVTNSTANLAGLIPRSAAISAEELVARLAPVTVTRIEEDMPVPDDPVEKNPLALATADDSAKDLPSYDGPDADLGHANQAPVIEDISVGVCPPPEPCSDATDAMIESASVDEASPSTDLASITEVDEEFSEDVPEDVEPWTPDYEIPVIAISPPSDVDPEEFPPQFDSEDEQEGLEDITGHDCQDYNREDEHEGSECNGGYELECPGDSPEESDTEVVSKSPSSDSWRSPITTSGMLWSDDDRSDLGPLPFQKIPHVEVFDASEIDTFETVDTAQIGDQTGVQDPPAEEGALGAEVATREDSGGIFYTRFCVDKRADRSHLVTELVLETAPEPIEKSQPVPVTPVQEVVESAPVAPVPSSCPLKSPRSSPRTSGSFPTRSQVSADSEDCSEGSGGTPVSQRPQYFHCCDFYKSDGRPASWKNWEMKKACIPVKTSLQESQFVRPSDKDGENPTTRIAIDNLDARWFRSNDEGVPSYRCLSETMGFFSTKSFRCWEGRVIHGVEHTYVGYATVDFDSVGEAIRMFEELQGRRIRGHTWHWRLEFVDPEDETHRGRKAIRTDLVPDSVKQALAAELEALTRRNEGSGHLDNAPARPPMRVRPQLGTAGRSLLAGAVANVVRDRTRGEEQPTRSSTRGPPRRPYKSRVSPS